MVNPAGASNRDRERATSLDGVSEIRRLLREARLAICSEPAAIGGPISALGDPIGNVRAAVSVTVGHVVMRLNQAGFTQSDRLYRIRDELAAGRPVGPAEIKWLNVVEREADA